jgi:hypothetical protein
MKTLRYLLLVGLIVLSILPTAVVGARDRGPSTFSANLFVTGLDEGTVRPIGNYPDGKFLWRVSDRTATGTVMGDFNGTFTFKYDGLLKPDQSGRIVGTMTIVDADGKISGPLTDEIAAPQFVGVTFVGPNPATDARGVIMTTISDLNILLIKGEGGFKRLNARGKLNGVMFLQLTADQQHVDRVLTGQAVINPVDGSTVIPSAMSVMSLTGNLIKSGK